MSVTTITTNDIKITPRVSSETGSLKAVLIHRPDEGIEKVTPARAADLLYDDIVYLPRMKEEHDVFSSILRKFTGDAQVYDFQNLLSDILKDDQVRRALIHSVCRAERCSSRLEEFLLNTPENVLTKTLVTGMLDMKKRINIFYPLPNLIFTRDFGAVVNDHLIIGQANRKARSRESVLTWFIFHYHPLFKTLQENDRLISLAQNSHELESLNTTKSGIDSLEGGDIMVLNEQHILIGNSERSSESAIQKIIRQLFDKKVVEHVTVIDLPKVRYCMHLDTIFTMVNDKECMMYEPLVAREDKMLVRHYTRGKAGGTVYNSLKKMLQEHYPGMNFIACGKGQYPFDEREQWTDGCNLFSVKKGVSFVYERNVHTLQALEENGYRIVSGEALLMQNNSFKISDLERTIITITSSELSRARGGPHCMTFPLLRN